MISKTVICSQNNSNYTCHQVSLAVQVNLQPTYLKSADCRLSWDRSAFKGWQVQRYGARDKTPDSCIAPVLTAVRPDDNGVQVSGFTSSATS